MSDNLEDFCAEECILEALEKITKNCKKTLAEELREDFFADIAGSEDESLEISVHFGLDDKDHTLSKKIDLLDLIFECDWPKSDLFSLVKSLEDALALAKKMAEEATD